MYQRWQKKSIDAAMKIRRVILLNGARQSGKTTLAKQLVTQSVTYRTLDDLAVRQLALNDPYGFVKHADHLFIIDEIQRAPELLSAIKLIVDEDTRPGQYLLTGSANIQSLPGTQESLAGRIRKIRLRPLCQGEILRVAPTFLKNAFHQNFPSFIHNKNFTRRELLEIAFRGGFPEAVALPSKERAAWHEDYIEALIERDLKDIAHITRYQAMRELINILAAWSGKLMDLSVMGSSLAIRRSTIESYINALEALYVVERVSAWIKTDYERVGKKDKVYMTDSGQMAALLNWHVDQIELDADRSGKLIETFIFNELSAQIDASEEKYQLFHYRDREQHEIDFLIERDDQALLGIEVKAGSSMSAADFKHLKWFQNNIANEREFIGIVLYTGETCGSMGKNLWAVPMNYLWNSSNSL